MYQYDDFDRALVRERVAQFRDQVARRISGALSEEEFLPLRLQNGLYRQKHAYMLRVAIPYGTLSAGQMRALAHVARVFDRGYGHFTTRQNIQFNWISLEQTPDILDWLAAHDMHAIQTSGNCVRNITTEAFAGVAVDECLDPRPLAEILRQWSTVNPEFLFLPRKFKIAVSAAIEDRAALKVHDIGLQLYRDDAGALLLRVLVGGGLGRTPIIAQPLCEGLAWRDMLSYVEAILRVYNRYGRRDNKYKARIKILVKALGLDAFADEVTREWLHIKDGPARLTDDEYQRVAAAFSRPDHVGLAQADQGENFWLARDAEFARWVKRNVMPHKVAGYANVVLSTKPSGGAAPGDVSAGQMERLAHWSERYGSGEIRVTHEQNLVLPDVRRCHLYALWRDAVESGLGTANLGLLTDIIACPGGDFCALANAKSIPIARAIQQRFDDLDYLHDLGDISLNISGCMNACGHHHIGNIGVLGVDKNGSEWYQVTLGGRQGEQAALGKVIGPAFAASQMPGVIEQIAQTYLDHREAGELFPDTFRRIGLAPFQARVYAAVAA